MLLLRALRRTLDHVLNIQHQTDEEGTIREIYDKIPIRGNNTWMLICSAMLASIGLDTGSGAVIIGAMLISPLMSPILGVGLSVGINDREMLVASAKNLALAAAAGLFVSTFYFSITPLGEPTNEILARTQPTLLDVMVAFFGGVAGIISISRSDRSNAIPGVAIATALMPPLCTAGYGLAIGRFDFFFGGFYLFFINAVFISLSTFLIVKYLNFHIKHYVNQEKERKVARIMAIMLVIVVLPSVYFLYNIYKDVQTRKQIENLVIRDFTSRNNEIIKWEVQQADTVNYIKIYSVGKQVDEGLVEHYNSVLQESALGNYQVRLVQLDVSPEEVERIAYDVTNTLTRDFIKTLELQKMQEQRADSLQRRRRRYTTGNATSDLKLLFPEIQQVQVGELVTAPDAVKPDTMMLVRINWRAQENKAAGRQPQPLDAAKVREYESRIKNFLTSKLQRDSVQIVSTY
ncbi:TIGR00341 family protein [Pontibacter brevis]